MFGSLDLWSELEVAREGWFTVMSVCVNFSESRQTSFTGLPVSDAQVTQTWRRLYFLMSVIEKEYVPFEKWFTSVHQEL